MKELELVFHGECHHIFSDDIRSSSCIKRYFEIHEPLNGKFTRIAVCNEYLRLKVRELEYSNTKPYWINDPYSYYFHVVKEIISEYTGDLIWIPTYGTKTNPILRFPVCKRPYIYSEYKFSDVLKIIIDREEYISTSFQRLIFSSIRKIAEYLLTFKKYKKEETRINVLLNRLQKQPYFSDYNYADLTELFLLMYQLQLNLKLL